MNKWNKGENSICLLLQYETSRLKYFIILLSITLADILCSLAITLFWAKMTIFTESMDSCSFNITVYA